VIMFFDRLNRFYAKINKLLGITSGILYGCIMFLFIREVVGRYFFNDPWIFTQDVSTMFALFAMFLAGSYVLSIDGFPSVDLLYLRFSQRTKKVLDVICYIAGLIFLGLLLWQTAILFADSWELNVKTSTPARVPMIIPFFGMMLGTFFFVVETSRKTVLTVMSLLNKDKV